MDHFSPVAPAHIRVLVLPVGQIERRRFECFLRRLQLEASSIPLSQVEQKAPSDGFFLSPKAFPPGSLLYRFSASAPSEPQQQLSPFELFREPLLVLGVVDGIRGGREERHAELERAAAYLKERHPRVVHRQLLFLRDAGEEDAVDVHNAVGVDNPDESDDSSLRQAICETSARFLVELTTYAKAMQVSPSIQTPGQTARSLQRTTSLRENEKRLSSGRDTPPSVSSPTDENYPSRPPSRAPPMPATSFDQIPSANRDASAITRSESRASNQSDKDKSRKAKTGGRSSSQDRVSVQGFGSGTSQEKARLRGRARVGIVLGSIYMMAGHWSEALRVLLEHTTRSRSLSDSLWHGKGSENMLVCMLLLAWSGVDFQVPSICDPITDRGSAAAAARITAETKAAAEGTKQQLQLYRLSVASPELCKLILGLYRSTEGSLELPFLQTAEATIRLSKLLAVLSLVNGEITPTKLKPLIFDPHALNNNSSLTAFRVTSALGRARPLSKSAVADLLAPAFPNDEKGLAGGDHVRVLAGIASTYALLGLDRKKAMTLKDLVVRLTGLLIQARKLGAAEVGIHPAASLSTDTGADTLLAIAEESGGVNKLLAEVSAIYGASLVSSSRSEAPAYPDSQRFGSSSLKFDLLRELAAFCEASPDPHGVLLLTTSLLRAAGPNAAIDAAPGVVSNALSRQEQMHLATMISRTVAVSKHLGLADVQAAYWDPFLVRGVEITQPSGSKLIIDRFKLKKADTAIGPAGPGNPLLYDPNASRPGTAAKQTFVLVASEMSACFVKLQNPFDIPVDVEELELVSEGVELLCHHKITTLGPLRFQDIPLMVIPKSVGPAKITGCRVKMQGCASQVFPIVTAPWSVAAPLTIKDLGLNARPPQNDTHPEADLKKRGIDFEIVSVTAIDPLPILELDNTSALESGLMLLEGESRPLELTVCNVSDMTASVFEIVDSADVLSLTADRDEIIIEPGQKTHFHFSIVGKAGKSVTHANLYYCAFKSKETKHARLLSIPVEMTVNAALQVHHLEIFEENQGLMVSLDLRNAWPKLITYKCCFNEDTATAAEGQLAPGEIRRLHLAIPDEVEHGYIEDLEDVRIRFLQRTEISWTVDDRRGSLNLRALPLPPESLALLRGAPVLVDVRIEGAEHAAVGSFVRLEVNLQNRLRTKSGPLSVALAPRGPDLGQHEEGRFAVAGSLQRVLPTLSSRAEERSDAAVDFVVCPLLAGEMEFEIVVKPVRIGGQAGEGGDWRAGKAVSFAVHSRSS